MILSAFFRALAQLGDPRFRRVFWTGILLAILLLTAVYALFLAGVQALVPETLEIPLVGPVGGLDTLLAWGSALFALALSVFLMVPVASAFTGLFLEDVVRAVEDRYYAHLPPVAGAPIYQALVDAANFFALIVAVNVAAVLVYPFAGPFAPGVFWAMNGFLLGREYFTLVAQRRLGRAGARDLRRRHWATVWTAGVLMAAPLSVPLVNLAIPVLGAATFTHLVYRLAGLAGARR